MLTDLSVTAISPVRFFHEALKVLHHNTPSCVEGVKMIEGRLATFVQICARWLLCEVHPTDVYIATAWQHIVNK